MEIDNGKINRDRQNIQKERCTYSKIQTKMVKRTETDRRFRKKETDSKIQTNRFRRDPE